MPLPLGHAAIGLAAYETFHNHDQNHSRWSTFTLVTILANLPDLDILMGLLFAGNGNFFHRGPTHSLVFAGLAGYAAANLWRLWGRIPRLGFPLCFGLVLSHVLADMVLTAAPVSLFWPFQLYLSPGVSGWETVMHAVLFQSIRNGGIFVTCILYMAFLGMLRGTSGGFWVSATIRRRWKQDP